MPSIPSGTDVRCPSGSSGRASILRESRAKAPISGGRLGALRSRAMARGSSAGEAAAFQVEGRRSRTRPTPFAHRRFPRLLPPDSAQDGKGRHARQRRSRFAIKSVLRGTLAVVIPPHLATFFGNGAFSGESARTIVDAFRPA